MAAHGSLSRVCSLMAGSSCPTGPWRQPFPVDTCDWHAVPSLDSRQACTVPLESPRAHWPGSTLPSPSCPSAPSYRTRYLGLRPSTGGKFKFPGLQKSHISKNRGFTEFNVDEFENVVQKSGSSQIFGEVTSIPHHALGTSGGPCTHS